MNTRSLTRVIRLFAFALILAGMAAAQMDARASTLCETTADGNWTDAIWTCAGGPGPTDDVIINHAVSLDVPAEVHDLTLYAATGITGEFTADEDLTITGDFTVISPAIFYASVSTITFGGTSGDQVIGGDGQKDFNNLSIANSGGGWVILNGGTEIFADLTIAPGSKFSYTGDSIEVGNAFSNQGTLRMTKAANTAASFPSSPATGFFGLDLVPPFPLGDVTVTIRYLQAGESCLTNMTSNYALRCFTVDPPLPAGTTVTLWAHGDELNGIAAAALAPYQYTAPQWNTLSSISRGVDSGFYYAQGVTPAGGGANFLLGSGTAPTALNLLSLTATSARGNGLTAVAVLAVVLLAAIGVTLWRRSARA